MSTSSLLVVFFAGPEIRTGNLSVGDDAVEGKRIDLVAGNEMVITTDDQFKDACTAEKMWVSYGEWQLL